MYLNTINPRDLQSKVKEKKFGEFYENEFALRQKQKQFLQYRGFYQDHIEYAVSANESS